ncbi:pimeloyl-ACP methyl ester carboxylesterase [Xanthomonas sacchari]|uniref:esterase/lipase family protein n=1 Tax=unclassified Xanthomonas TaxID=2643310 RepID=UPI0013718D17|nr:MULTISPECIES: alpha/beta hydrolase [unclassified Xanthomonas]MBB6365886.1 pimeloyl-ACP methyl ester carboxylesterase [Xanthomonas sp. F10]MXV33532.1 alpha/beta hydrolase [Xanthomonas sp. LMG 8989]
MRRQRWHRVALACVVLGLALCAGGCASVTLQRVDAARYIQAKRGDALSAARPSHAALQTLNVAGLDAASCTATVARCVEQLLGNTDLDQERALATASELSLLAAQRAAKQQPDGDATLAAWLQTARYAYAYLFFSGRTPSERAFEERQTQVRDYYNYAVQQAVTALFARYRRHPPATQDAGAQIAALPEWTVTLDTSGIGSPKDMPMPEAMLAASGLRFDGLRSVYRRDGFGAEMVAVLPRPAPDVIGAADAAPAYSDMPTPNLTVLLRFDGRTLKEVLSGHSAHVEVHDPSLSERVAMGGADVPLAANFSAGYGVWMARAGFAAQSLRTLLGLGHGIDRPHVFLTQPYDPNRRVLVLLHGLASSPEAWVNLANDLLGDPQVRARYQIWLVYYPTNLPIPYTHLQVRTALQQTLDQFDPQRRSVSAHDMVLIGHSMGGVLARLMVSSSDGERLWRTLFDGAALDPQARQALQARLGPMLHFAPMPEVSEAIFLATPQRGTPEAAGTLGELARAVIGLPRRVLDQFKDIAGKDMLGPLPNSIDSLSDRDPFILAAAQLPISPQVTYHSIIGQEDPRVPLTQSSDGIVPYWSAHLPSAASETVIVSGHSVQQTPQAILQIRRLLH